VPRRPLVQGQPGGSALATHPPSSRYCTGWVVGGGQGRHTNYYYYYCCYDDDYYCCHYYCKLISTTENCAMFSEVARRPDCAVARCFLKLQGDQTVRSQIPALAVVKPSTARKVLIRLSPVLCRDCGLYPFLVTSYSGLMCQAKGQFGMYAGTISSSQSASF
jgi:hypothetical protein